METTKKIIKMRIDGIALLNQVNGLYQLKLPSEIIHLGYDSEGDVLNAHFKVNPEVIDSEIVEEDENVILGLDKDEKIVRITILNASKYEW